MIVMKKNSLKLNELVRSELELTEQAVIKGGGGNDGDVLLLVVKLVIVLS